MCVCVFERKTFLQMQMKRNEKWYPGAQEMETTKLLSRQTKISENFQVNLQKISNADLLSVT